MLKIKIHSTAAKEMQHQQQQQQNPTTSQSSTDSKTAKYSRAIFAKKALLNDHQLRILTPSRVHRPDPMAGPGPDGRVHFRFTHKQLAYSSRRSELPQLTLTPTVKASHFLSGLRSNKKASSTTVVSLLLPAALVQWRRKFRRVIGANKRLYTYPRCYGRKRMDANEQMSTVVSIKNYGQQCQRQNGIAQIKERDFHEAFLYISLCDP